MSEYGYGTDYSYEGKQDDSHRKVSINNPGIISRISTVVSRKDLISLDVCIEDTTDFSPYYFNIIRKPLELKLGGNILEFSAPRDRFKIGSEIKVEIVDSQNNPLSYEVLPRKAGTDSIRICIFVFDTTLDGPGTITLVGEAIIDECGCPLPPECKDKLNVRWSCVSQINTNDVSAHIEYDNTPAISISETKIPYTYQTFEDVYNINPGSPGSPYTVSGSYTPVYNSEVTNSGSNANNGKFLYNRDVNTAFKPTDLPCPVAPAIKR
mgnify:FL=1